MQMKPDTRTRTKEEAIRLSNELHLAQLRKASRLTQEAVAELLGVSQSEVSKIERRSELCIGTLKRFIEAMIGELVLAARFTDGVEVPTKLADIGDAA
jgi:transcriptional regulator with XRE-family HTH domain